MNLDFTEEQLMLRESARDFLTKNLPKKTVKELEDSQIGYSPGLWKQMADLGWMGLVLPEEYGGFGMSFVDLSVLIEEMGRACLPGPFFSTVVLGALPILEAGNEKQQKAFLPRIAKGEAIFTLAIAEETARYDATSVHLKAIPVGNNYVLNGLKMFVPYAHVADYLLCAARTDDEGLPGHGITVFIVDAKSPGISSVVLRSIANDKLCEVQFEDVIVAKENILGRLNTGWPLIEKAIERAAAANCCDMSGSLQRVLEMTVAYAKDRVVSAGPIGSFQAIQHHCANMAMDVYGTMLSAYQAAWKISESMPCSWEVATAKAWASQACPRVIALAHQIHGAIGTTMDHDLHFYTRRTKAAESAFGDTDFYQWKVARQMCPENENS
jgi:3-oxocholest-4-en-26-oyl-CoA dehydrogenase beta subunit